MMCLFHFFFDNLIVNAHYLVSKQNADPGYGHLFYQYTLEQNQQDAIEDNNQIFERQLIDDIDYGQPLLLLGVAGNGKTIAVFRQMYTSGKLNGITDKKVTYIDLDEGKTKIRYGLDYKCKGKKPYEMFGLSILEHIIEYLRKIDSGFINLKTNHYKYFVQYNNSTPFYDELFDNIALYKKEDRTTETRVFQCVIDEIEKDGGLENNIQKLLEILMTIMFCAEPISMKYIFIDNIEEYIKLNKVNIQIPDSDLARIYQAIKETTVNMQHFYKVMTYNNPEIKTFKILIAMRRTSLAILEPRNLQFVAYDGRIINDVTGQIQLSDIWLLKKKENLWGKILKGQFEESSSEQIIHILDTLMEDGPNRIGVCYQSLIAPLMSYGLRRNARAQAYATERIYRYLLPSEQNTINYETYCRLIRSEETGNNEVRYMLRRALIEIQFKWSATSSNNIGGSTNTRWKDLNIGYLAREEIINIGNKKMKVNTVEYDDPHSITLARRILSALTYESNRNITKEESKTRLINTMFPTISLYKMITRVLDTPQRRKIEDSEYMGLAKVLLAMGNMANGDTKGAPYIILNIDDDTFQEAPSVGKLAILLKRIKEKGNESAIYTNAKYSVRITDAGISFLLDWQYSFTFFAAIYCYSCPPLFFLRNEAVIKYVIKTVYDAAKDVCGKYYNETKRFCSPNTNVVTGTYMPIYEREYGSFIMRVKKYHYSHLTLYYDYIKNHCAELGIEEKCDELLKYIRYYQDKYRKELFEDGDIICF